jgi:hypothetical protein
MLATVRSGCPDYRGSKTWTRGGVVAHTVIVGAKAERQILVAASVLLGPTTAAMYQTGMITPFGGELGDVWIVAIAGAIGLGLGVYGIRRRSYVLGGVSVLANAAVSGLYGFLALFFSLGGSR